MKSIRISDELYAAAEGRAGVMTRSIAQQLEHWAKLGIAVEAAGTGSDVQALLTGAASGAQVLELLRKGLSDITGDDAGGVRPIDAAMLVLRGAVDEAPVRALAGVPSRELHRVLSGLLARHAGMTLDDAMKLPLSRRRQLASEIERAERAGAARR